MFLFIISRGRFYFLFATVMVELFLSAHRPRFIVLAEPPPDFLESILSVNSGSQIIVSNGCIISFIYFCRRNMAQPFQQSSIVIPAPPTLVCSVPLLSGFSSSYGMALQQSLIIS